jgi:hypothetical protein
MSVTAIPAGLPYVPSQKDRTDARDQSAFIGGRGIGQDVTQKNVQAPSSQKSTSSMDRAFVRQLLDALETELKGNGGKHSRFSDHDIEALTQVLLRMLNKTEVPQKAQDASLRFGNVPPQETRQKAESAGQLPNPFRPPFSEGNLKGNIKPTPLTLVTPLAPAAQASRQQVVEDIANYLKDPKPGSKVNSDDLRYNIESVLKVLDGKVDRSKFEAPMPPMLMAVYVLPKYIAKNILSMLDKIPEADRKSAFLEATRLAGMKA